MFSRNTYIKRRIELARNLKKGFILFLGHQNSPMNFSHNAYRFVQDTNFLYYVGVDLPNCACLIDVANNKTTFYMKDKKTVKFVGKPRTGSGAFFYSQQYHEGNKIISGNKYLLRTDLMINHNKK